MPNIRSAKKRVKVSATKTAANKARKSNLKTMIKKADAACAANAADKEAAVR
ncbi:MAG: 30S ribosomal protein S20, partial [Ruminococcus sp.]